MNILSSDCRPPAPTPPPPPPPPHPPKDSLLGPSARLDELKAASSPSRRWMCSELLTGNTWDGHSCLEVPLGPLAFKEVAPAC